MDCQQPDKSHRLAEFWKEIAHAFSGVGMSFEGPGCLKRSHDPLDNKKKSGAKKRPKFIKKSPQGWADTIWMLDQHGKCYRR